MRVSLKEEKTCVSGKKPISSSLRKLDKSKLLIEGKKTPISNKHLKMKTQKRS
jgi:hypothetical protein